MLRSLIKTGAAYGLHYTGAGKLVGRLSRNGRHPLILGYHRVAERMPPPDGHLIPAQFITARMLEKHLDWIGRRYRVLSLDDLADRMENGGGNGKPCAAITFDDGYEDVYRHGFPILKRKGIPATVFVVTGFINDSRPPVYDVLYMLLRNAIPRWQAAIATIRRALEDVGAGMLPFPSAEPDAFGSMTYLLNNLRQDQVRRVIQNLGREYGCNQNQMQDCRPLTWEMVAEMQRAGMTIGSHTQSHPLLPNESPRKVLNETAESRRELENRLRVPIRHFAYPDGRFDNEVVNAVGAAGYSYGYTICNHQDGDSPLLTIPRRMLWENSCLNALGRFSSAVMSCQAGGTLDFMSPCARQHIRHAGPRRRLRLHDKMT